VLENQHEIRKKQDYVHGSLEDIRTTPAEGHCARQQGQQQQNLINWFESQRDGLPSHQPYREKRWDRQADGCEYQAQKDID
jgi:hypothetical protein